MRRLLPCLLACLPLALAACGGHGPSTSGAPSAGATAPAATPDAAACARVPAPKPKDVHVPRPHGRLHGPWIVSLRTSCGTIRIRLATHAQPRTAESFSTLVRRGFYDGLTFHRIARGFVIQGGDPHGDGSGGPGYTIVEKPPASARYTRGVVGMAKTEVQRAGASGSQFFIVTEADAQLPPDYAILGRVVGGMGAVDRIAAVPTGGRDQPLRPVVIEKATLRRG